MITRNPNLHFLMIMYQTFRISAEMDPQKAKELVKLVTTDVECGRMPGVENMDNQLLINFKKGYEDAIGKYGLSVANERMTDFLLQIITKNSYYTEESLNKLMDKSFYTAWTVVNGIHLTQDETGEYHEN